MQWGGGYQTVAEGVMQFAEFYATWPVRILQCTVGV